MGRHLQLFEGEELFLRFRPHFLSFLPHYSGALSWIIAGLFGAALTVALVDGQAAAWGVLFAALLGLGAAMLRKRMRRAPAPESPKDKAPVRRGLSLAYAWFGILFGMGIAIFAVFVGIPEAIPPPAVPVLFTATLAIIRIVGWEIHRMRRVGYLTSTRIVARTGIGNQREESLPLDRIHEVRSDVGPLGQMFNYGTLSLVTSKPSRAKNAVEESWVLAGIAPLSNVKHQVEQLLAESRLPTRDRKRQVEERRLRESMRALAAWMRKSRA